jgi:predicted small lipoprotein YifL
MIGSGPQRGMQSAATPLLLPAALLFAACLAAGCGQPGPVLPPSADIPTGVSDLRAQRSADEVRLRWTPPRGTTDAATLTGPISAELCAWPADVPGLTEFETCPAPELIVGPTPAQHLPQGAVVPLNLVARSAQAQVTSVLATPPPLARAAVAFVNARGEAGPWSNSVALSLVTAGPPPTGLTAALTPKGIALHWTPPSPPPSAIRIYRQAVVARGVVPEPLRPIADVPGAATSFVDSGIVPDTTYIYIARGVTGSGASEAESVNSSPVTIVAKQIFPPPAPTGLQVVLTPGTPPSVDMSWLPVSAPDLAGYNIYRRPVGTRGSASAAPTAAAWQRRNQSPALTPVFHDAGAAAESGTFEYAVTAVDRSGNESAKSEPARVLIPPPQ